MFPLRVDLREAEVAAHQECRARRPEVRDGADPAGLEREGVRLDGSDDVQEGIGICMVNNIGIWIIVRLFKSTGVRSLRRKGIR